MFSLIGKNILLTGGTGFLGSYVAAKLRRQNVNKIIIPRSATCDLRVYENCHRAVSDIDIVIHLAGNVGGIGYNQQFPGNLFYDNILMGTQLMEAARLAKVEKFVAIGTVCCYPKFTPVPFKEKNLWDGYPEETNAPYGLAKKMLLVQSQTYRAQYNFNSIFLLPVNLYGPGDNFRPNQSHVIPALIKKIIEAKETNASEASVWGSGKATREFLYVEDAADAIILASQKYDKSDPINIGSRFEISIKELAEKICDVVGFKGKLVWDLTKPDGQPRRVLDVSLAQKEFGFKAQTKFDVGLKETIRWYQTNLKKEEKIEYL